MVKLLIGERDLSNGVRYSVIADDMSQDEGAAWGVKSEKVR